MDKTKRLFILTLRHLNSAFLQGKLSNSQVEELAHYSLRLGNSYAKQAFSWEPENKVSFKKIDSIDGIGKILSQ